MGIAPFPSPGISSPDLWYRNGFGFRIPCEREPEHSSAAQKKVPPVFPIGELGEPIAAADSDSRRQPLPDLTSTLQLAPF